jgi:hypothetical protein
MVPASVTVAAFLLMVLPVFGLDLLQKRRRLAALRTLAGIGFAGAAYCMIAGIAVLAGVEPFQAISVPADLPNLVAGSGDQAGFAVRAVQYWPYGLIVAGCFWTIVYAATQWNTRRR